MTSEEISNTLATDLSTTRWLKEVAYQLALLNEKKPVTTITAPLPRKVK